jgi:hypothetical protein
LATVQDVAAEHVRSHDLRHAYAEHIARATDTRIAQHLLGQRTSALRIPAWVEDERKANVWLFFDDNQRIFDSGITPPEDFMTFELTVNCRNTQAIHREAMKHYQGAITPDLKGPPGREVDVHRTDDQPGAVAELIEQLCGEEEVPPQDLVVLSAHGVENSEVFTTMRGSYEFTRARGSSGKRCTSPRSAASRASRRLS